MRFQMHGGLGCLAVHTGAALLIAAFCLGLDAYREWAAAEMLERVGGDSLTEWYIGRSAIVEAKLVGVSPTAEDLATLVPLRALQIVDLSFSRIGDCELAALVPCRARLIIVPDGCTSRRVRQQFAEGRLVIGYGPSHPGVPTVKHYAKPYLEEESENVEGKTIARDGEPGRPPKVASYHDAIKTSCFADNSSSAHSFADRAGRPN